VSWTIDGAADERALGERPTAHTRSSHAYGCTIKVMTPRHVQGLVTLRRALVLGAVLAVGAACAVWLRDDGRSQATAAVAVARGDVVVTAGGVGRIVDGAASNSTALSGGAAAKAGTSATGASSVPADAVFPQTSGVVAQVLVTPGQQVVTGQPLAVLSDGGNSAITVDLSRNDLLAAQLEAAQVRNAGGTPTELALAQLKVDAAQRRLALDQLAVDRLTVRTPRDGTVTALLTLPGNPADATTPIATIADLAHLAVSLDVSEFDAAKVRVGQTATLSVDALGGASFPGTVETQALAGVDNGGVVTFPVQVQLDGDSKGVKPGMSVNVRIVVEQRRGVMLLPLEAVSRRGNHDTVTTVDAKGRATSRVVSLGIADNKHVEIRGGLRVGESVRLPAAQGV
jgi:RND family efflux transporter MFP subunit